MYYQEEILSCKVSGADLTLLHSERPNLYTILAFLIAIGLNSSNSSGLLR